MGHAAAALTVTNIPMFKSSQEFYFSPPELRGQTNSVRLRTLVILRWIAISGQISALLVSIFYFRLELEVGLAVLTIGVSALANLLFTFLFPENKRLNGHEALLMLVFDIFQLGALLYLTGGLHNPFALLLLAPVIISATALDLRSTVLTGLLTILMITAIGQWNILVLMPTGQPLALPSLYLFGFWLALIIGIVFLSYYAFQVASEITSMSRALTATQLALAREQKLTDLGGVVAAAAHELGTPLATIKLAAAELHSELDGLPEQQADAALIGASADRCRDILRSMGQAGKDDLLLRRAPLEAVVKEAAEPHRHRGKAVHFAKINIVEDHSLQPNIMRRPEIIHGLRNLVQNAVDFAETTVEIEFGWSDSVITIRIEDDGPGFPGSIIGRIGDPFVRRKRAAVDQASRPEYEGMGLGLFIAKTLLERSGARLTFANGGPDAAASGEAAGGAIVLIEWPLAALTGPETPDGTGLGENQRIHA